MTGTQRGDQDPFRYPAAGLAADETKREADEAAPDEEGERLEGLPEHERDADTSQGAGLTSSGVMAEQRGPSQRQPDEGEDQED